MKTTLKQREIAVSAYLAAREVLTEQTDAGEFGSGQPLTKEQVHRLALNIGAVALRSNHHPRHTVEYKEYVGELIRWLILSNVMEVKVQLLTTYITKRLK